MEHNDHIQTPNNPLGDEIDRDDGLASMHTIWEISQIKRIFCISVNFVLNSCANNKSKTFSCKVPRAYLYAHPCSRHFDNVSNLHFATSFSHCFRLCGLLESTNIIIIKNIDLYHRWMLVLVTMKAQSK